MCERKCFNDKCIQNYLKLETLQSWSEGLYLKQDNNAIHLMQKNILQ